MNISNLIKKSNLFGLATIPISYIIYKNFDNEKIKCNQGKTQMYDCKTTFDKSQRKSFLKEDLKKYNNPKDGIYKL